VPEVRDLVLEFYFVLRSLLKAKPHLRPLLACCRHCGILFPTHPRNRGRRDLGCPFGCRQAHSKKCSKQRNKAFYETENGKAAKKEHNNKRSKYWSKPDSVPEPELQSVSPDPVEQRVPPDRAEHSESPKPAEHCEIPERAEHSERPEPKQSICSELGTGSVRPEADDFEFDPAMVKHVRMVTSLIEGRDVGRAEIIQMLNRCMRQRSMGRERRIDYVLRHLTEHPP
jgi:hypothetical protein